MREGGASTTSPGLARHLEADVTVGMLIPRLLDGAGERELLGRVVAAPPVVSHDGRGPERRQDETSCGDDPHERAHGCLLSQRAEAP